MKRTNIRFGVFLSKLRLYVTIPFHLSRTLEGHSRRHELQNKSGKYSPFSRIIVPTLTFVDRPLISKSCDVKREVDVSGVVCHVTNVVRYVANVVGHLANIACNIANIMRHSSYIMRHL